MCQVAPRDHELQKLLEQDAVGLNTDSTTGSGTQVMFELLSAEKIQSIDLETCMSLIEQTSGDDYRASSIGWHPKKKKEEMLDEDMLYLLVRQNNTKSAPQSKVSANSYVDEFTARLNGTGDIQGFISFMFTQDDPPYEDRDVVYIYEIHLLERLRGRGLGSKLIAFVELAAKHHGISKTMLTVFTANKGARGLYEKLGYGKDECSPKDRIMRRKTIKADYVIMSKELA